MIPHLVSAGFHFIFSNSPFFLFSHSKIPQSFLLSLDHLMKPDTPPPPPTDPKPSSQPKTWSRRLGQAAPTARIY